MKAELKKLRVKTCLRLLVKTTFNQTPLSTQVLTNKQEIVDLDRKRNSNREALSAFDKKLK